MDIAGAKEECTSNPGKLGESDRTMTGERAEACEGLVTECQQKSPGSQKILVVRNGKYGES